MAVSDGAIFALLAVVISLFLFMYFNNRIVKMFGAIMIGLSGIGVLRIDPTYGWGGLVLIGAGLILFLIALFGSKGKGGVPKW